jgi:hypothetical protein
MTYALENVAQSQDGAKNRCAMETPIISYIFARAPDVRRLASGS